MKNAKFLLMTIGGATLAVQLVMADGEFGGETPLIDSVSATFSATAIRAGDNLQINVSLGDVVIPKSTTIVTVRTTAQEDDAEVMNFTFDSTITNGAYLAVVLTDFDFGYCDGYSVSVSNSLFAGAHDFGLQSIPEESDIVATTSSGDSYDDYESWYAYGRTALGTRYATSTTGVIEVTNADAFSSYSNGYSSGYDYDEFGERYYYYEDESGNRIISRNPWQWHCEGNEIRVATRMESKTVWENNDKYEYVYTSYVLPDDAPGKVYVKMTDAPVDLSLIEEYYPELYSYAKFVTSSGQVAWCQDQEGSSQHWERFLPISYGATFTATGSDGNTYSCAQTKELLLLTPPSTTMHEIRIGVEYYRDWNPLTPGCVSEKEDYDEMGMWYYQEQFYPGDQIRIMIDDGNYWGVDCDNPLEYQSFVSGYGVTYDEYGNPTATRGGIYIDGGAYYPEYSRPAIVVPENYYIRKIYQVPYGPPNYYSPPTCKSVGYYKTEWPYSYVRTGWLYYDYDEEDYCISSSAEYLEKKARSYEGYLDRHSIAFIGYDPEGHVVTTSPRKYDSQGNPLPIFGPVTDDTATFWFFAAPIPYNITFIDPLGAENPNSPTYTIEDCYDFLPLGEVDGWDFLGWDIAGVANQTGDITVTAQWRQSDRQVTFNVGAHGSRTGGGELEQTVVWGEAAVSPEIAADCGWVFTGWDAEISRVTESMTVTALYERAPLSIREATGLDKAWATGGDAEWFTEWTEDAHDGTNHLHSGAIGDGQESWIETVVTNTGVVSFWWKASSEAYRGIAYDTLVFTVDGEIPESVPPIGGEVDWTNVTLIVEGDGPHALRWTYRKDASDSDGEDCAWLDDVQYLREVHVTFADGGATAGAAPDAITVGEGAEITLPGQSSLAWPKHRFIGWRTGDDVLAAGTAFALGYDDVAFTAEWEEKRVAAPSIEVAAWHDTERTTVSMSCETAGAAIHYTLDGSAPTAASQAYTGPFSLAGSATIKAVAVLDDWFDSEVVSAVSVRAPWTPDECLNATGMVFRTGGDAKWVRDRAVAHDGDTAMRSGDIDDGQTSWIEVTVTGAGTLSFWWRASSESYKGTLYDLARLTVDGVSVIPDIGGEIGWRSESVSISGGGAHVVRWAYIKDSLNSSGEDCAWLDEVSWTPSVAMEPLPELEQDTLPGDVAAVMAETADASLSANVTNAVQYAAFRTWALAVTNDMVTAQAVKESSLAWLSFALGADALIGKELTTDDVRIESFTPASAGGNYEITVSVKDVDIGGGAVNEDVLKENLKKVLGIEGARTLAPDSFSSDNIDITFGTPVDGKARIIVSPPPDAGSTFFMRVKVK